MSASRLRQPIELARLLGGSGAKPRIAGELTIGDMPRLGQQLVTTRPARVISASLKFWRDASGLVIVDGQAEGKLALQCQRCLEEFDWPLAHAFRLALQDSERGGRIPQELEILDWVGDSIVPADLIEEEILLALPLVASHPDAADCGPLIQRLTMAGKVAQAAIPDAEAEADAGGTVRPFAGLSSLLPDKD